MQSQSGVPQAPLGYESFEHHSSGCSPGPKSAHLLGPWPVTHGQPSRPVLGPFGSSREQTVSIQGSAWPEGGSGVRLAASRVIERPPGRGVSVRGHRALSRPPKYIRRSCGSHGLMPRWKPCLLTITLSIPPGLTVLGHADPLPVQSWPRGARFRRRALDRWVRQNRARARPLRSGTIAL
jgi:hypothetical protein